MLPNSIKEGCYGRLFPADKMYTYVKGAVTVAGMQESIRALPYMRKMHEHQFRSDGQRYEIHPLSMACYALSLMSIAKSTVREGQEPCINDTTIAVILLHDVPEEAKIAVESMPFGEPVLHGVKYMTVSERFPGETKFEQKRRYARELLEDLHSVICKGIDMYYNLSTMQVTFEPDKVRKNIVEADMLRMPVLREAKNKYPEATPVLWVLRENITLLLHNLALQYNVKLTDPNFVNPSALQYNVKLTDPNFVNPSGAKDYSYLITGAEHVAM